MIQVYSAKLLLQNLILERLNQVIPWKPPNTSLADRSPTLRRLDRVFQTNMSCSVWRLRWLCENIFMPNKVKDHVTHAVSLIAMQSVLNSKRSTLDDNALQ